MSNDQKDVQPKSKLEALNMSTVVSHSTGRDEDNLAKQLELDEMMACLILLLFQVFQNEKERL